MHFIEVCGTHLNLFAFHCFILQDWKTYKDLICCRHAVGESVFKGIPEDMDRIANEIELRGFARFALANVPTHPLWDSWDSWDSYDSPAGTLLVNPTEVSSIAPVLMHGEPVEVASSVLIDGWSRLVQGRPAEVVARLNAAERRSQKAGVKDAIPWTSRRP